MKNKKKRLNSKEEKKLRHSEEHGKQLVKSITEKEYSTLLKQKEVFEELANEQIN